MAKYGLYPTTTMAYAAIILETVGAVCVALGLFTRIFAPALDPMPFGSSLDVPVSRNQFTFGVNYYFYASLVLRFAWEINRELGLTKFSDDQFLSQLAWAF